MISAPAKPSEKDPRAISCLRHFAPFPVVYCDDILASFANQDACDTCLSPSASSAKVNPLLVELQRLNQDLVSIKPH